MAYAIGFFIGQSLVFLFCTLVAFVALRWIWRLLSPKNKNNSSRPSSAEVEQAPIIAPVTGKPLLSTTRAEATDLMAVPADGSGIRHSSLPTKHEAEKARKKHDQQMAELQAKRAAWDAEHKRQPRSPAPAAPVVPTPTTMPDDLASLRERCREMTADGSLDEEEIHDLKRWLDSHPHAIGHGVERMLAEHMDVALADGDISVLEAFDLFDLAEAVAQGKSLVDMSGWEPMAPFVNAGSSASRSRPKRQTKIRTGRLEGIKLDTIRFSYRNANGEYSERRVVVRVVDDDYFEGRCLTRQAMRTFRLDRIIGSVTSEQTGEVASPYDWASGLGRSVTVPTAAIATLSTEILFTGFRKGERDELESLAESAGMIVRKSVTQNLTYLCAGPNAGPSKLEKARQGGVSILDQSAFYAMVETIDLTE